MSKLTDKIDEVEREYAVASGEYALAVLKSDNDAPEAKMAERVKLEKLNEYNELVNLKRSAEIAADGGEIEITVRGTMEKPEYTSDFHDSYTRQHNLVISHMKEITERQNETKGE